MHLLSNTAEQGATVMQVLSNLAKLLLCFGLTTGMGSCGRAETPISTEDGGRLGEVQILAPADAANHVPVVLVVQSVDADTTAIAQHVAAKGHSVVVIDWSLAEKTSDATDENCHFLIGDLERFVQSYQTTQAYPRYVPPVLVGIGEGADVAYALLAQAPSLAISGAVGIGRTGKLKSRIPFCNMASEAPMDANSQSYGPSANTMGWWRSLVATSDKAEIAFAAASSGGSASQPNTIVLASGSSEMEKVDAAITVAQNIAIQDAQAPLTDLPLTPLKSAVPGDVLAIIISGDGGWRDLDRQLGFELAKGSVSVVGVDSLHYFWQAKSPQTIADDLTRIVDYYSQLWNTKHVLLIGYSFGADIMPAAVDHMSDGMRSRIDQISLLGMGDTADYEIHVTGWLGVQPKGNPVEPDARKLDLSRVQCFYGLEEDVSFCRSPLMQSAEVFGIAGGHHFDGNYQHLADLILAGLKKRLADDSSATSNQKTEH